MKLAQRLCAIAAVLCCNAAVSAPATLATLTLGEDTGGIGVDTVLRKAFVTNYATGTVSVVDVDALQVTATIAVGANPRRLLSNAALNRIYFVNDTTPGKLTIVDGKTGAIIAAITVGNRPRSLAADFQAKEVYVTNRDSNSVSIVDLATNTVVVTLPVGTAPTAIDVNTTLGKIYVPSSTDGTVSVIDQHSRTVTKTITVGKNPSYGAVAEWAGKVYVNNVTDKTVSVIDSATDTVIKTIPVGAGSTFGATTAIFRRVYLPNSADNTLSIIDGDTDTVVKTVPVGASPVEAIIDNIGGDVYIVNQGDNSVTVIDARTETVTGTFLVGGSPWRAVRSMQRLFVLNQNGAAPDTLTIATLQNTRAGTALATEFYYAGFDHYFHSTDEVETRVLQDGLFGNAWNRTLKFWRVWTDPGPGRLPVCRFFSATFAPKSSHFFTPYSAECDALRAAGVWVYEGTAYSMGLPDIAGNCPAGTEKLYRLYNNGQGDAPNHRLTPDSAVRNQMKLAGWIPEGNGDDVTFACTPSLRGD